MIGAITTALDASLRAKIVFACRLITSYGAIVASLENSMTRVSEREK